MRKLRFYIRLLWAFLWRFKAVIIVSVAVGLSLFLIVKVVAPFLLGNKENRIAMVGRFHPTELPSTVLSMVGRGLTRIAPDGSPLPDLATNWEQSEKGQKWTFHLNDNKWQDGSSVTSGSINYSFEDVKITKPDSKTIVFELKNPYATFPVVLAKPVFKQGLLGTGKWYVSNLSLAGPYVESITLSSRSENIKHRYKFYPTEESAKLAFKLGQVDKVEDVIDPKPLNTWTTTNIQKAINEQRFAAVFFNVNDPALSEKTLRQALSYATDRSKFEGTRALGPIAANSWAYNSQVKPYDYDPKRAKEIIDTLPEAVTKDLKIKLATTPLLLDEAEKIARDWETVGIKTTVQVTTLLPNEYQAFLALYDIPYDPDQYSTWHSTQIETGTNISKYKSPRIDKLLEEGRIEMDPENRKKNYLDFQRFLLEDAPAVFLYHPISYTIARK